MKFRKKPMTNQMVKWTITPGYGGGWFVTITANGHGLSRYFGPHGGEWEVRRNGDQGKQLVGTLDIHAPHDRVKFGRWVRRRLAYLIDDLREYGDTGV